MTTRCLFFAAILFVLVPYKCHCEGGYESYSYIDDGWTSSSNDIPKGNGPIRGNNNDHDDDGDDNEDGEGLIPVAVVAIAAGIPIGVVLSILIVILACCLAGPIKRKKTLGTTSNRNTSVNQYTPQGLTMTASRNNEDSEMVYNSAYQSVSRDDQPSAETTDSSKI
ncbi:hypothetical protein HOLleu_23988 [Holothuria leucospilota]|uniref:Uncharacterized protein n=1 Tax=Holothuria leucospilota TaxID=206669 RepID=A0A9Q1BW68_HOLLE|nr:hypothetical protein HOLleu_23988 [Holothuria leucospilota]